MGVLHPMRHKRSIALLPPIKQVQKPQSGSTTTVETPCTQRKAPLRFFCFLGSSKARSFSSCSLQPYLPSTFSSIPRRNRLPFQAFRRVTHPLVCGNDQVKERMGYGDASDAFCAYGYAKDKTTQMGGLVCYLRFRVYETISSPT